MPLQTEEFSKDALRQPPLCLSVPMEGHNCSPFRDCFAQDEAQRQRHHTPLARVQKLGRGILMVMNFTSGIYNLF